VGLGYLRGVLGEVEVSTFMAYKEGNEGRMPLKTRGKVVKGRPFSGGVKVMVVACVHLLVLRLLGVERWCILLCSWWVLRPLQINFRP